MLERLAPTTTQPENLVMLKLILEDVSRRRAGYTSANLSGPRRPQEVLRLVLSSEIVTSSCFSFAENMNCYCAFSTLHSSSSLASR